jgi:hypothetical protein
MVSGNQRHAIKHFPLDSVLRDLDLPKKYSRVSVDIKCKALINKK